MIKLKRNSTFQVVESFNIPLVDVSPGAVEDEIGEKRKGKKTFTLISLSSDRVIRTA